MPPMSRRPPRGGRLVLPALTALLAACAGFGPAPDAATGPRTRDALVMQLGPPALRWPESDGGERLAFPTGPMGIHTWMARVDAVGRVLTVENVLVPARFAEIQPGMGQDEVLRTLGPPQPNWTIYYKARDELVWEWRFCDDFQEPARFDVLFDGTSGRVRSTLAQPERLSNPWGRGGRRDWCSR